MRWGMCSNVLGGLLMLVEALRRKSVLGARQRRPGDQHSAAAFDHQKCPAKKFVSRTEGRQAAFTTTTHPAYVHDIAKMKLNVKNIRYLTPEDWRVLTAVRASTAATSLRINRSSRPGLTLT
jgi:L-amino acid N-acyltransferase YncA